MANTDQKPSVRTVHLVMAGHFESDEAVRAFTRKPAAEAFAKSCAAYDCTHPISPSAEDSNEAWDKYMARLARWKKRHPAGESAAYAGSYYVVKIALEGTAG